MTGEPGSFGAVWDRAGAVEGWLTPEQGWKLFDAARTLGPGATIVEIGSFRGRSTIVLAASGPDDAEVVAIDPHGGGDRGPREITPDAARGDADHAAFTHNLSTAGVENRVRHVRKLSADALDDVPGEVDLLFVDGAHRLGPARADIVAWGDRVGDSGTMLVHDAFSSVGVTLALLSTTAPVAPGRIVRYPPHGWNTDRSSCGRGVPVRCLCPAGVRVPEWAKTACLRGFR